MNSISRNKTEITRTELPLATLAILAYNQENLIADAIKGALSQTYKFLEIIISDDCSCDKTYENACKTIANIPNIRDIRIARNHKNLGLISHLNEIIKQAKGDIIILAAGDDISHPERCEKIVYAFQNNPYIYAIHTGFETIDENGTKIESKTIDTELIYPSDLDLLYNGGGVGLGATYAYRKKCFTWPRALPTNLINEDRILPWRACLLGGILYLNESLVSYRLTPKGLSRDETIARWPARKNKEHLKTLICETNLAYRLGNINKDYLNLYTRLLKELFYHMDILDLMNRRGGIPGRFLALCTSRLFILKYKLLKKITQFKNEKLASTTHPNRF